MQLVEQHCISKNDPGYSVLDEAAFKSKNLYHAALYEIRQSFFQEGRNILIYTVQAISKRGLKRGLIQPSRLSISIKTKQKNIDQVRIVPRNGYYVVAVIYTVEPVQANVDSSFCVGIDLGVTNVAAIASNREGFVPRLVNGRALKAWNQWSNKRIKELKKQLPKDERERVTRQMERITNTGTRRIDHYLHTASRRIIDFLVENGRGTLIISLQYEPCPHPTDGLPALGKIPIRHTKSSC